MVDIKPKMGQPVRLFSNDFIISIINKQILTIKNQEQYDILPYSL